MFLEFLEFLHGICFVGINVLISSFGFDFVCSVSSRVLLLCLDFSGCPTFGQRVCLRACIGVLLRLFGLSYF